MFVIKSASSTLRQHPWRTALVCIVTLIVTSTTVFSAAVISSADKATGSEYQLLQPVAVLHQKASTAAKRNGADPNWTKQYLTLSDYNTYVTQAMQAGIQPGYAVSISLPVRQSDTFTAIKGTADQPADKTGGEFTLSGAYADDPKKAEALNDITIVAGQALDYENAGAATDEALISQAVAKANGLKVGDSLTVGNPTDAATTYTYKIRGIYTHNAPPAAGQGADAKLAKDNQDNTIYAPYSSFGTNSLATTDGTGWSVPNLDIEFSLSSIDEYERFAKAVAAKLPDTREVTSPTLTAYKESIAPLESFAATLRTARIAIWTVGAAALLALAVAGTCRRRNEIGTALTVGVTRWRMTRQFMLETLIPFAAGFVVALILAGFGTAPLAAALFSGRAIAVSFAMLAHAFWIALASYVALSCVLAIPVATFRTATLFAARENDAAIDPSITDSPAIESTKGEGNGTETATSDTSDDKGTSRDNNETDDGGSRDQAASSHRNQED